MSTDVDQRTEARFEKMRPLSAGVSTRVDPADVPDGPKYPGLLQSIALMRFRHQWIPHLQRKYGDVFSIRILPEGRWLVVFNRPEHVKEIFAGDPEVFHAGKGNAILGPVMGEHSLLLVDGAQHRRARKLLMPAFNGHALRGYESMVTDLTRAEVASWTPGRPFESLERMNALTLEVILQVVFGVTDEARLAELRPLVNRTVNVSPAVFLGWGFPRLQRYGPWRRAFENQVALDRVIYAEIAERRRATDLESRSDVLSRLLLVRDDDQPDGAESGLTDEELRDQLVTLLLAGHETTASTLAWTFHELGRNPRVLARAQQAADTGDDDYLDATVKESMRLHPVIRNVARLLTEPVHVGGYDLPAGVTVFPSIMLVQHTPRLWPSPEEFRPERFLGANPPSTTWFPFGGGIRRCLGAGLAGVESLAVLRTVLRAFDVTAHGGPEQPKTRNITTVPSAGARIVLRRR